MNDSQSKSNCKAFINSFIYTVNEKQPVAEAVVIKGNKIVFAGNNIDAKYFIDSSTQIFDLKDKMMLPGFSDSHIHFLSRGFRFQGVNLRNARSTSEFKNILKEYIARNKNQWNTWGGG